MCVSMCVCVCVCGPAPDPQIGIDLSILPNEIKLLWCWGYEGAGQMKLRGGASKVVMKYLVILYQCGKPKWAAACAKTCGSEQRIEVSIFVASPLPVYCYSLIFKYTKTPWD